MNAPRPVLIHGSGATPRIWSAVSQRFEGAATIALPGHDGGVALRHPQDIADALADHVAAVPGPRAIVGHSLGGAVALELALRHAELVDGLVLITSGARLPVPDEALARARADFPAECRRLIRESLSDPDARVADRVVTTMLELGGATLEADYAACRAHDLRRRLGAVTTPALVVAADEDRLTPPWLSEELARELPLAHLVLLQGAGHLAIVESAGTLNLLLAAFLARLELTLAGR